MVQFVLRQMHIKFLFLFSICIANSKKHSALIGDREECDEIPETSYTILEDFYLLFGIMFSKMLLETICVIYLAAFYI